MGPPLRKSRLPSGSPAPAPFRFYRQGKASERASGPAQPTDTPVFLGLSRTHCSIISRIWSKSGVSGGQKVLFVSSTIFACCMPSNRPRREAIQTAYDRLFGFSWHILLSVIIVVSG